jgi:hypothetical protein
MVLWILLPKGPADRCHGSCYLMAGQIGAWILLPTGPADGAMDSATRRQIGAMDPVTHWASR